MSDSPKMGSLLSEQATARAAARQVSPALLLPAWLRADIHTRSFVTKPWQQGTTFPSLCQVPNGPGEKIPGKQYTMLLSLLWECDFMGERLMQQYRLTGSRTPRSLVPSFISPPYTKLYHSLGYFQKKFKGRTEHQFLSLRSHAVSYAETADKTTCHGAEKTNPARRHAWHQCCHRRRSLEVAATAS